MWERSGLMVHASTPHGWMEGCRPHDGQPPPTPDSVGEQRSYLFAGFRRSPPCRPRGRRPRTTSTTPPSCLNGHEDVAPSGTFGALGGVPAPGSRPMRPASLEPRRQHPRSGHRVAWKRPRPQGDGRLVERTALLPLPAPGNCRGAVSIGSRANGRRTRHPSRTGSRRVKTCE